MTTILACVDGSPHMQSVCTLSAWAAQQSGASVTLLHVVPAHADIALHDDLSGQIGLGAKTELMQALVELDAERAKIDQKKGQIMLQHATAMMHELSITDPKTAHRRGTLADTVADMQVDASIIVIGKRGETATKSGHLGSNLERVTRAVNKPLLIATKNASPVARFLIAYDGSENSKKALNYVCEHSLLKKAECHLLKIGADNDANRKTLQDAEEKLTTAGFTVIAGLKDKPSIDDTVSAYVDDHKVDLLVMGAYGHSAIRRMIFGSTTMAQVERSKTPVLLFR